MTTISMDDIAACFDGEVPAMFATADADGTPNLGHVSQVFRVDDQHGAVSNQFLGKSITNLRSNALATLVCLDPQTIISYQLLVRYVRTESTGPTFAAVQRSIDAIAAMTGMADVFALRAVEVMRVLGIEPVPMRGADDGQ